MFTIIPDLENRGLYSFEALDQMEHIYRAICAELRGVPDQATRQSIAFAILHEFDCGNQDMAAIRRAARAAARPAA
jgi:hypothetical protein